jgi:ribonuclease BN (tRNA processing enzyme)
MMQLEVIGNSCGRPSGGNSASGYVVHGHGKQILLDCGPGVATVLTERPLTDLSAIFVSHAHYDHCADLLTLGLCLIMSYDLPEGFKIPLFLPAGSLEKLVQVAQVFPYHEGKHANPYEHVFETREYTEGEAIQVGDLTLTPVGPNIHSCPAWSCRITDGEQVFAYSGDSAYHTSVMEAAQGADLLLCESIRPAFTEEGFVTRSHMSAEQAGSIAQQAGAKALLISHITRHDSDWKQSLVKAAAQEFAGPLSVTEPGAMYSMKPFAQLGRVR